MYVYTHECVQTYTKIVKMLAYNRDRLSSVFQTTTTVGLTTKKWFKNSESPTFLINIQEHKFVLLIVKPIFRTNAFRVMSLIKPKSIIA